MAISHNIMCHFSLTFFSMCKKTPKRHSLPLSQHPKMNSLTFAICLKCSKNPFLIFVPTYKRTMQSNGFGTELLKSQLIQSLNKWPLNSFSCPDKSKANINKQIGQFSSKYCENTHTNLKALFTNKL